MFQSSLLCDTVQLTASDTVLVLNSAADSFVSLAMRHLDRGALILSEDNIAMIDTYSHVGKCSLQHTAFHNYCDTHPQADCDLAVMNLMYQPANMWMFYGLRVAAYALKPGGKIYVAGAKDRGILTIEKHMQELFGNTETLVISKGQRVISSVKRAEIGPEQKRIEPLQIFADSKLDEGTRLLLEVLEVRETDRALDIGCGAGFIGLAMAQRAIRGDVTMVDVSLVAVEVARAAVQRAGYTNVSVLPSDSIQAVSKQHFDLIATNPPFHQGGIQTIEIAERFIRGASSVLQPQGRFYLVANRFLKYEPTLKKCFQHVEEVGGDSRYKVLKAFGPFIRTQSRTS